MSGREVAHVIHPAPGPRKLTGSREQLLVHLNTHWGREYSFAAPSAPGGTWSATAKSGGHDRLEEQSAGELLEKVRRHYRVNKPQGGRGDQP
jgi:hypothetical protein